MQTATVGQEVSARWEDGSYYKGVIVAAKGNKRKVKWEDGETPSFVDVKYIRVKQAKVAKASSLVDQVFDMLSKPANAAILTKEYGHIKPFKREELPEILAGEDGAIVTKSGMKISRSYQFSQLVSAIGANSVDKKKADKETVATYKAIWAIEVPKACAYCKKPMKGNKLMFKMSTCAKPRCVLNHMRECV